MQPCTTGFVTLPETLPQQPTVLEMTNAAPWRIHIVPTAILQDGIYQRLDEQQQVQCPLQPIHCTCPSALPPRVVHP